MSKQTTKRSYSTVRTNTFKGIDCRTFSEEGTCMEMNNFRIVDQQIIEKREGYKWLMTLPGTPTATWRGNYEGDESIFVLIGNVIFAQDDITADITCKQEHILQHLAKMAAQAGDFDLSDIDDVN